MESILQREKRCFVCGKKEELDCHHVIHGNSNRQNSEAYGLKIWLCRSCHSKVHNKDRILDLQLIEFAQRRWEEEYGDRNDFISVFGKSWL